MAALGSRVRRHVAQKIVGGILAERLLNAWRGVVRVDDGESSRVAGDRLQELAVQPARVGRVDTRHRHIVGCPETAGINRIDIDVGALRRAIAVVQLDANRIRHAARVGQRAVGIEGNADADENDRFPPAGERRQGIHDTAKRVRQQLVQRRRRYVEGVEENPARGTVDVPSHRDARIRRRVEPIRGGEQPRSVPCELLTGALVEGVDNAGEVARAERVDGLSGEEACIEDVGRRRGDRVVQHDDYDPLVVDVRVLLDVRRNLSDPRGLRRRRDRILEVERLEARDLLRLAVLEDGEVRGLQAPDRAPVAVEDRDVEDDGLNARLEARRRRVLLLAGQRQRCERDNAEEDPGPEGFHFTCATIEPARSAAGS